MNFFRKLGRYLDHLARIEPNTRSHVVLDPERVVNRVIYGTDYHPDDVSIQKHPKCLADE